MCWSATADLVAGAGISAIGLACVARVRRARDLPLAALPLLLGAHQIIESSVWRSGGGTGPATVAWAVIALPVLALWVPLGVLLAAPPRARLRPAGTSAAGLATAAALSYSLATRPVTAEVRGHTLGYVLDLPASPLLIAGYLLATVGSLLLGGDPLLRLLGALVGAGAVICALLWRLEFVSTWCAFAAVASVVMLAWVHRRPAGGGPPGPVQPAAGTASR
ncbi:hypothetical protein NLX86_18440 [Streptomyces sp. A3M-1-3]|uniref:DUF6629 family protein n=1 Tax=Streptomyces sp. A3M-1-3 TaxID=2962044 RepID=UPI0020B7802F|nr:DUF6629 family protein [Streptomyces sp. A3M-1-3]MCP3820000.1 hypothetical protein [Streptomyces sp. A3M-1-3]